MAKRKVEEVVEEMVRPITEALSLELIDVEYKKEGKNYVLRIIIDKPNGITIDDCENVSREVDQKLDELDPIENSYNLEVQSPGEMSLKKDRGFEYFKGREVEVKLYEAIDGKKTFEGVLLGLFDGIVKIKSLSGDVLEFSKECTANVKLKIRF